MLHILNAKALPWQIHFPQAMHDTTMLHLLGLQFMSAFQMPPANVWIDTLRALVSGGQLSSYLRMRYPDVIAGAISSSPTSFGCPGLGLVSHSASSFSAINIKCSPCLLHAPTLSACSTAGTCRMQTHS